MENQRQETRLHRNETIFIEVRSVYPASDENCELVICHSADMSANGVRAVIDQHLPVNAIYQLCVELHETEERLFLAGQVKWCGPDEDDTDSYNIGIEIFESDDTDIERWKSYIANALSIETT